MSSVSAHAGFTVYLHNYGDVASERTMKRLVIAYDGSISTSINEHTTHVFTPTITSDDDFLTSQSALFPHIGIALVF